MRYIVKPEYVDAEVYRVGLEDGFSCMSFVLICKWHNRDGKWKDCANCPLDIAKKPYIQSLLYKDYIDEGDYIVTDEVGDKVVMSAEDFEAAYVQVEENSDCDN